MKSRLYDEASITQIRSLSSHGKPDEYSMLFNPHRRHGFTPLRLSQQSLHNFRRIVDSNVKPLESTPPTNAFRQFRLYDPEGLKRTQRWMRQSEFENLRVLRYCTLSACAPCTMLPRTMN